ncbi:methionine--tRNA ligase [Flagellimonas sp. CMM7]|uniref:methionine--tRNA ligase n=1 Tax=Flagellimonas sp. CMM7 TaxID=2654676 RepID=UPI0013D101F8|nr:methionine--tRNA ligase [Flagellimonas sp. CMM7]UII81081.1 methionine--tRNA ligase [Flagellimonas sp. CMM7]
MGEVKRYLITSALPYANGPLHVGHLAGAYVPADIYVRYLRLLKHDVKFICGSDEHGAAITMRAKTINSTPKEIVEKYHAINKQSFKEFGISFDIYHRTSASLHHKVSQDFFKKLNGKNVFRTKVVEQYYDEKEEQFLADRYIQGQCPKCNYQEAFGDQCESCGSDLSPSDLIDPRSTLSGNAPVMRRTKHWFLPMQEYQQWVSEWIRDCQKKEHWKKHVLGQCESWIKQGLRERAMTRDLEWGVKVPLEDAKGKVLYVWLDAPIGYISATQALTNEWEKYWKDKDTKLVHFIGKDNIVFHCIIFPILLHAHGEYTLPINIPANQFMNLEKSKISTSRNHAVWLTDYMERFPEKQDALRYYLTVNMPENKDSDFAWKEFQAKVDSDLVGVLGGFFNRTFSLIHKNFNGRVGFPKNVSDTGSKDLRNNVFSNIEKFKVEFDRYIHGYEFKKASDTYINLARQGNKLLHETSPWKIMGDDPNSAEYILALCMEIVAVLVAYMEPLLPFTCRRLKDYLEIKTDDVQQILDGDYKIEKIKIGKVIHFFERIDSEAVNRELDKLNL